MLVSIPYWCDWKNIDLVRTNVKDQSFNSLLVRLEEEVIAAFCKYVNLFQFLIGAIGRITELHFYLIGMCFNSLLVRLEGKCSFAG